MRDGFIHAEAAAAVRDAAPDVIVNIEVIELFGTWALDLIETERVLLRYRWVSWIALSIYLPDRLSRETTQ